MHRRCPIAAVSLAAVLTAAASVCGTTAAPVQVERLPNNPIIHPGLSRTIGTNIQGPSLIRAPSWIKEPLGKYYLYFAHHGGKHVRLAYADDLEGPWKIHDPGVLSLAELKGTRILLEENSDIAHIASPDVHVDEEREEIWMYFHGPVSKKRKDWKGGNQITGVAFSKDGMAFKPKEDTILGPFYFRAFRHRDYFYAIAKSPAGAVILRSRDGVSRFDMGPHILPKARHTAVKLDGDLLYVFYSRGEDTPERLLVSTMKLKGDWQTWTCSKPWELLRPERDWEGADLPIAESKFGAIRTRVHQLRDPAYFHEDGQGYLLYSVAGEAGIAIAKMTIDPQAFAMSETSELCDFEDQETLANWSAIEKPDGKTPEPPATLALSGKYATTGTMSLAVTFSGGSFPAIGCSALAIREWGAGYKCLIMDVGVLREAAIGVRIMDAGSRRGMGWHEQHTRFEYTTGLRKGQNTVTVPFSRPMKSKSVTHFEVYVIEPEKGDTLFIDNIRLSKVLPDESKRGMMPAKITVPGLDVDLTVPTTGKVGEFKSKADELVRLLERPTDADAVCMDDVKREMNVLFAAIREEHPKAVLASFREGDTGFDPTNPEAFYSGWKDANISIGYSDASLTTRIRRDGEDNWLRSFSIASSVSAYASLYRLDLSSIPKGSEILAARLAAVPTETRDTPGRGDVIWVAIPSNRDWDENHLNAYRYGRSRFWKTTAGLNFTGEDPDSLPVFIPLGPELGSGDVVYWDFAEVVRFFTNGKYANHGFRLHCDGHSTETFTFFSSDVKDVEKRPVLMVVYEPASG